MLIIASTTYLSSKLPRYLLSIVEMDFRQLSALVAVADHKSFSAAARALHTVQSNISTHVARLERELDVTLVERRSGDLTAEGTAVVRRARIIRSELQSIDSDVSALRDEISGEVRCGMIGTSARWLLPRLLELLDDRFEDLRLITVDATTTSLVPLVADSQLDLALVQTPIDHPDIATVACFEEEAIVLAPIDHELAQHDLIDMETLSQHRVLIPPPGIAFRNVIDKAAERAAVELTIRAEVDGMRLLASLAFQGFAPAIVPTTAAPLGFQTETKRVRLSGMDRRSVGIATSRRTTLSAPALAVQELLFELIATAAPDQPGVYVAGELAKR